MDNGQSRGNLLDAAWLAGVIDGEGHLGLRFDSRRAESANTVLHIGNCSKRLLEKAQKTIYRITHRKPKIKLGHSSKPGYQGRKTAYYQIQVYAQKDIARICEAILPHLTAKREQASLLLGWCKLRMGVKHRSPIHKGYGPKEQAIIKKMEAFQRVPLSTRARLVETNRLAPNGRKPKGEEIVQP